MEPVDYLVRVFPRAGRNEVRKEERGIRVYLEAAPEKGRANRALVEVLAGYFGVSGSAVIVKSGRTSRVKKVRVNPGGKKDEG